MAARATSPSCVVNRESPAASIGAMLAFSADPSLCEKLGLDQHQVVLFGLEGATDPEIYESLVGKSPVAVLCILLLQDPTPLAAL
ncbi:hypothetical protein N7532_007134 [Penicillium argentinense]|uniref:Uncharacterized protein n=1 Tax=Penicillium argentinense TaxID=1131581 RepID=A0A9W9FH52_9EURO|nr:uncharacterized protein N7532_007134 [Penicillium argentinense]KAJ5100133.1 hypothetical protein N7532_007134 [Penicillium argentinense]